MKRRANKLPHAMLVRVFELRCRAKRGEHLSPEEHDLCMRALRDYPDWYRATERDVFVATAPFGARIERPVKKA